MNNIELYKAWMSRPDGETRAEFIRKHGLLGKREFDKRIFLGKRYYELKEKVLTIQQQVEQITLGTVTELQGDFICVGDIHSPCLKVNYVERVARVALAELEEPRHLIIAGDWCNMDNWSKYPQIVMPPQWSSERDVMRSALDIYLDVFETIIFLMGNHERRLQIVLQGAFEDVDIIALLQANPNRIKSSNFGYLHIDTQMGRWLITHPKNYSVNQLITAEKLANKHHCHVMSFHEHHLAVGWDRYKKFCLVNGGSLLDPELVPYLKMDNTTGAGSASGFVMLRGGVPTLFGEPPITDWSRYN